MNKNEIKSAIESLMFVYSEPISIYKFSKTFDVERSDVTTCLKELEEEYIKDNHSLYRERMIGEIYKLYDEKLKKSNSLDFDDLLLFEVF